MPESASDIPVEEKTTPKRPLVPVHLNVSPAPSKLQAPTSFASGTLGAVEGSPGSWGQVALGTVARAALIAPGFYLAGERRWTRLALGAAAGSAIVTVALLAVHAIRKRG